MSLLESLTALLSANQFLAGGIGTLVAGSVLYLLRAVPQRILELVERTVWTRVSVESLSNEYKDIDQFIESRRIGFFGRSLEAKDGSLKTGFGSGWGTYDGTLFRYAKTKSTQQIAPFETITLSFLTRDRGVVERFIAASRPEEHRNSIHVTMFGPGGNAGGLRRRKRALDTVFADDATKARLVERIQWFQGAEAWHAARGIPWKIGIVLYGPPGTGKTSLIHALASHFSFDIKYVKSLAGVGTAFLSGRRNDLFVIEDIDTLSGSLDRDGPGGRAAGLPEATPLHELLNSMDGMQTPDGLKFIVTTNHLKRLDPAIVRPGRIDEVVEIGPLSLASAREMFRAFYGRDGLADPNGYTPRTGAELQRMFSTMAAEAAERALAGK